MHDAELLKHFMHSRDINLNRNREKQPAPASYPEDYFELPYGVWVTKDGAVLLFNREYEPIYRREPGKPPERCNPHWVKDIVHAFTIWDDWTPSAAYEQRAHMLRMFVAGFMDLR